MGASTEERCDKSMFMVPLERGRRERAQERDAIKACSWPCSVNEMGASAEERCHKSMLSWPCSVNEMGASAEERACLTEFHDKLGVRAVSHAHATLSVATVATMAREAYILYREA